MPTRKLPPRNSPEYEALVSRYKVADNSGRNALATELGMTPQSIRRCLRDEGILIGVPESQMPTYDRAPKIRIERGLLCLFDAQIPYHDAEFINKLLDLANVWGCERGVSGGDLINMTSFSYFLQNPEDRLWQKEAEVARGVLTGMADAIPKWLFVKGNHEGQLMRAVAEQFNMQDILRLLDKPTGFQATDYYYCLADGNWRLSHPRNISVIHGRIPTRLCAKFHQNVASGHGHLCGMNPDDGGKYIAIDAGVTCDPKRLDYASMRDTTRPAMAQGALILKRVDRDIYPYLFSPLWTDWNAMRRLYKE